MIVYKSFTGQLDETQNLLAQQQAVRSQMAEFINETAVAGKIVQISELMLAANVFSVTVWYEQPKAKAEPDFSGQPEAQSADVLSRSLREQERRELVSALVDEHIIRSNSS